MVADVANIVEGGLVYKESNPLLGRICYVCCITASQWAVMMPEQWEPIPTNQAHWLIFYVNKNLFSIFLGNLDCPLAFFFYLIVARMLVSVTSYGHYILVKERCILATVCFITWDEKAMFSPLSVCWLVLLFVSKTTQKQLKRFPQNLVEGWGNGQESVRKESSLVGSWLLFKQSRTFRELIFMTVWHLVHFNWI